MEINAIIIDSLIDDYMSDGNAGGNAAALVMNAGNLSSTQKLQIATKVGLSETAFVSDSKVADFKVEFFTPNKQIPHCGHATIATYSYLLQNGFIKGNQSSKETIDGIRKIYIKDKLIFMEQRAPKYEILANLEIEDILKSLNLSLEDTLNNTEPTIVNTGNSFLLIGVKSKNLLRDIRPNFSLIEKISEKYGLIGYYVFTLETEIKGRDAATRMFAPFYGINEESATGMAAGPLACYLYDKLKLEKESFHIEQGYLMPSPSPSLITVELGLNDGKITSLIAGGTAKVSKELEIRID